MESDEYIEITIEKLKGLLQDIDEFDDETVLFNALLGNALVLMKLHDDINDQKLKEHIRLINTYLEDSDDEIRKYSYISKSLIILNLNDKSYESEFIEFILNRINIDPFNCILASIFLDFYDSNIIENCKKYLKDETSPVEVHVLSAMYISLFIEEKYSNNYMDKINEIFKEIDCDYSENLLILSSLLIGLCFKNKNREKIDILLNLILDKLICTKNIPGEILSNVITSLGMVTLKYKKNKRIFDSLKRRIEYENLQCMMDAATWIGLSTFDMFLQDERDDNLFKDNIATLEKQIENTPFDVVWASILFYIVINSKLYDFEDYLDLIQPYLGSKNEIIMRGILFGLGITGLLISDEDKKERLIQILQKYGNAFGLIPHKYSEVIGVALIYSNFPNRLRKLHYYLDCIENTDPFIMRSGIIGMFLSILMKNELSHKLKDKLQFLGVFELLWGNYELGIILTILKIAY